jgi:DNA-directed RNA polymerase subunit beta'
VVVGRLIPAGTGLTYHADRKRQREEELAAGERETATADEIEQALSEALAAQGSD